MQMVCYHVHVALSLRLSNDVEENPGPGNINEIVDHTYTVHAEYNQGNQLMFGSNAGKQCVAMTLCSIVYNQIRSVNIWNTSNMNQILVYGNNLYRVISQSINKDFLLLTDVPELLDIDNHTFNLEYRKSFSGGLFMTANNYPYVTLENAFNETFVASDYKSCLLTIGMNTVAILMPFPDGFKFFHSHSRNLHGMPCAFGYSVLTSVEGVRNLVEYFHFTSCSYSQNFGTPFELKGVKCDRRIDVSLINSTALTQSESSLGLVKQNGVDKSVEIRDYSQRKYESSEQKEKRLAKATEYKRQKRQNESCKERQSRLRKCCENMTAYRNNLSSEQQEKRVGKCRESMITYKKNESSEQ